MRTITKLSTMREQVRKSFKMTDAELLAWFNRKLEEAIQKPKPVQGELDALRLLRDALRLEAKKAKIVRKSRRAPAAKT